MKQNQSQTSLLKRNYANPQKETTLQKVRLVCHDASNRQFLFFSMSLTSALGYGSLFSETGVQSFFIMILCTFIGFWSACRVNGAFHAPLMGLTNAMSSMVIFLAVSFYKALPSCGTGFLRALTTLTIFFLSMNLVGGLLITQRMLSLFTKQSNKQ